MSTHCNRINLLGEAFAINANQLRLIARVIKVKELICLILSFTDSGTIYAEVDFSVMQATGKYICSICGYVYDPAEYDGVAFEELPEDWKCPRCKHGKENFNKA